MSEISECPEQCEQVALEVGSLLLPSGVFCGVSGVSAVKLGVLMHFLKNTGFSLSGVLPELCPVFLFPIFFRFLSALAENHQAIAIRTDTLLAKCFSGSYGISTISTLGGWHVRGRLCAD